MDSHFHVSPEMFDWAQVRVLAGPLKNVHKIVPLLCWFGCELGVFFLLEGEPSVLSEVLTALDQVFFKDSSVLYPVSFLSNLISLPVLTTEGHPHACFTFGIGLSR